MKEETALKIINERDAAERALSQAYYLITGKSPEWSNLFGHKEVLQEIDEAQQLLRTACRKRTETNNIFTQIRNWARDHNLIEGATVYAQMLKLTEEVGELAGAIAKGKPTEEIKKEIGDCGVVLTILALQQGVWIEDCLESAHDKNKDRQGKIINGIFVKNYDIIKDQSLSDGIERDQ